MVKGIAFYALYKSRVPYKADDSCLFIELPDEIYKKRLVLLLICNLIFVIVL